MSADKAYSPYGVFFMAVTILCVLSGAIILAFAGARLYKRSMFWVAALTIVFPLAFAAARFLLLVAPTPGIYAMVSELQLIAGVSSAAAPFVMLLALIISKHSARLIVILAIVALLNAVGIMLVLKAEPIGIADFYPAAFYIVVCCFYFWSAKKLFPELAVIESDAFLKGFDDLILVFDKRDRLMRASSNASEIFGVRENMTREEFNDIFNETATIQEDKSVWLAAGSEIKYYQSSETVVKTRGGTEIATVMMFSDVTEITKLKTQLSEKNDELNALNNQLEIALKTAEKLEAEQQKEKAILELEQAIGKKLENLTREIEAANALQNLSELIEACRDIMAGVRQTVSRLTNTKEGE